MVNTEQKTGEIDRTGAANATGGAVLGDLPPRHQVFLQVKGGIKILDYDRALLARVQTKLGDGSDSLHNSSQVFGNALREVCTAGERLGKHLILDLRNLLFLDTRSAAELLMAGDWCAERKLQFLVTNLQTQPEKTLRRVAPELFRDSGRSPTIVTHLEAALEILDGLPDRTATITVAPALPLRMED